MKRLLICFLLTTYALTGFAQTNYDYSRIHQERLDRGVVAVRTADGKVAVSWRTLMSDPVGQPYDIYRNGEKLNAEPLTSGGTFFVDEHPLDGDATYRVSKCSDYSENSEHSEYSENPEHSDFTLPANAPVGYLTIPLQKPEGGTVPVIQQQQRGGWRDNGSYHYTANDASVGDVDGDGQYELFLKWEPTNAHDNSHDGYTGPVLIDCYRLDGTRLWRINLGRNIRAGAHYTQFMVYDFDGDGRAELMCRTSDGTTDGAGTVIGDSTADYRNPVGRILEGREYLTVFDGLTGRALDTKPYIPERGKPSSWGDNRANRSDRFLACVAYLGNTTTGTANTLLPSAVFCRGYYTRSVLAAWDWDGRELRQRWTFDTNEPQWASYAGQGNHNLRVADVDGDGLDEITYGSMAIDHDGRGLYNTGMGHGDALHLVADPKDNSLYIWDCHENRRDGSDLRNARTGEIVFQVKSDIDVGRCMAADIDPTSPGCEMWSIDTRCIYDMQGNRLSDRRPSINFGIWWDGDLLRELLDHEKVTKYDWVNQSIVDLQHFDGCLFNNSTKSNPCLSADILGDWREEVVTRNRESTELRIYTTTIPTSYRVNCLMQDIPYRLSVATQNVAYNQPSELGYYLGPDRTDYLK